MYRNSAQMTIASKSLPSPENTSDSESELIEALDQKRRQLDDEIAKFKTAKDQEFQDFERELRLKRSRDRRKESAGRKTSKTQSALSLFAGTNASAQINGHANHSREEDKVSDRKSKNAPASKPTLLLDRSNINGSTGLPLNLLETPPTPNQSRSQSRSPGNKEGSITPPLSSPNPRLPPTPTVERPDSFAGLFTPAYLPLLESRPSNASKPKPSNQRVENENQASFSLPKDGVSPLAEMGRPTRANTTPTISSASLPSALRTASGTSMRKRKHVTFRLADQAIVDPNSSYEELPSPDPRGENGNKTIDEIALTSDTQADEDDYFGQTNSFRKYSKPLASPTRMPPRNGLPPSPDGGFSGGLQEAEDGGSGVGFFELDEELESPGLGDSNSIDVDEVDGDLDEAGQNGRKNTDKDNMQYGSFSAGSLPIDIVRPSGSWVGSLGH